MAPAIRSAILDGAEQARSVLRAGVQRQGGSRGSRGRRRSGALAWERHGPFGTPAARKGGRRGVGARVSPAVGAIVVLLATQPRAAELVLVSVFAGLEKLATRDVAEVGEAVERFQGATLVAKPLGNGSGVADDLIRRAAGLRKDALRVPRQIGGRSGQAVAGRHQQAFEQALNRAGAREDAALQQDKVEPPEAEIPGLDASCEPWMARTCLR